ncbi:hypothetical protein RIR_jg13559.t1 [Rhizophagus irregularis DAOM 181602=DAOM 197198]|uniref:Uncharacterized protein n=1 Tax=Rhizophagus irregularis (strain DAOM 181602 / DAOM 197198 / MUCL 43194) TaxID=747089 RepID=U9UFZ2_RHIID|nr:hypothetical protein RIR_jg13559.t1 [Rhizophagus irregularis DAOM 181602=DAOM 197198]
MRINAGFSSQVQGSSMNIDIIPLVPICNNGHQFRIVVTFTIIRKDFDPLCDSNRPFLPGKQENSKGYFVTPQL